MNVLFESCFARKRMTDDNSEMKWFRYFAIGLLAVVALAPVARLLKAASKRVSRAQGGAPRKA